MNNEDTLQYVCQNCGYNMAGYHPDFCPFCGATKDRFLSAEENSERRHIEGTRINESVTRINSVPALGYEHAAYRVVAGPRCHPRGGLSPRSLPGFPV
jgi:hydroxyacylglutathione hydrolase